MREAPWKVAALVAVVLTCFALNSLITRYLVSEDLLDPASVTVARFVSGALMLAAILASRGRVTELRVTKRDAAPILFLGAYAVAIAWGYRYISAAAGTFVFYTFVVGTMTLADRPSARAIGGGLVALAGVGILALGRVEGTTLPGVIMLAATGAAWGAYSLALRSRGEALGTNARAFLGFALVSPLLLLLGPLHVTAMGLALGVVMGAITTALSYALWARVLPSIGRAQAGVYQLLVPVLTAGGGVTLLDEAFGWRHLAAGALVLAGMALATAPQEGR